MKRLILVRHAKSSWKDPDLADFERPLNKRGKRDAPLMAKLIAEKGEKPDVLISSPALRAYTTAREFAKQLDIKPKKLIMDENIYEAGAHELMGLALKFNDEHNSVMLFGHNPGLTLLNNYLSAQRIDNIPTCGVVCIEFEIDSWKEIKIESGRTQYFEYPKLHKN
ncbi:MAG: histidine phosphatase family protein [Melioribacteraceae bacterium]|nr:histidine phosphatase family protein [Melioribacteraceae bacterium]MCF8355695.1 histidine phosphatase family protein [Melioribacteraceae bacterium]MCF8394425.1 histidine phosphatase family protein [Melioribacteraceae bacterium]MCF8418559.1 histidine phosphatase family protein [Melioribacteraceae bacterium]